MALFDFLKNNKGKEKVEDKFVGRHQQVCLMKQMLGEEVPSLAWQIAVNKDLAERNEILEKIEELEKYINSELYTTQHDVAATFDEIRELIDRGYQLWVFQNDSSTEDRCFDIYGKIIDYSNSKLKKEGVLTEEQILFNNKKLVEGHDGLSFLNIIDGEIFDSPIEQHSWFIYISLRQELGNLHTYGLITDVLTSIPVKDLDAMVAGLELAKTKLLENKIIEKGEGAQIEKMIKAGIAENKKIHEQQPSRS